jgi:hypothetical protein
MSCYIDSGNKIGSAGYGNKPYHQQLTEIAPRYFANSKKTISASSRHFRSIHLKYYETKTTVSFVHLPLCQKNFQYLATSDLRQLDEEQLPSVS